MTTACMEFNLASGRVAGEVTGPDSAPLVIGIPGLFASLRSFDILFRGLPAHRRLAFDPRGRGRSDKTPSGTYGWPSHVRDILEMADQLGAERFDLVGWSMGVWIALTAAQMAPERVRRLVLIDALGTPEEAVREPIGGILQRLGTIYPTREAFYEVARHSGFYEPWSDWEAYFEYAAEEVEGGVRSRTPVLGPWEDELYRRTQDLEALWHTVQVPALLVRAALPIPPNFGNVLTREDYQRFLAKVPTARGLEVDAHHFSVAVHPDMVRATADFLSA